MTLLELVAALALFVIILGSLLMILNAATSLWSASRNQNKEQAGAQAVLELIADDLRHAVTDNDPDPNAEPAFVMESPPTNPPPNNVALLLGFVRHGGAVAAGSRTTAEPALSVEAVCYTLYNSALYRHVVALPFTFDGSVADKPLGQRLAACVSQLSGELHGKIYNRAKGLSNPLDTLEPTADWSCSLLAENASIDLRAALPGKLALPLSRETSPQVVVDQTADVREYRTLETRVLPDRMDIAIGIQTEASLNRPPLAADGIEFQSCSQRITFPSQGGSRLP